MFGNIMLSLRTEAPQDHHVSVKYGDGFHSFRLARGTTLGDLAARVGGLDTLHESAPLSIEIILEGQHSGTVPAPANCITIPH
jgi:hypothetical protein